MKYQTFRQWVEAITIKGGPNQVNDKSAGKPITVDPTVVAATAAPGDNPSVLNATAQQANQIGQQTGQGALKAAQALKFKDILNNNKPTK